MRFDAKYTDKYGDEVISVNVSQNGLDLSTKIREVEFRGRGFMEMIPTCAKDDPVRNQFSLCDRSPHYEDCLQQFNLSYSIPLKVVVRDIPKAAILKCDINIPACDAEENDDTMKLVLEFDQIRIESPGTDRGYEWELGNIQSKLGNSTYLKCCFNCRYSGYNPYSNSMMMGDLACFLNTPFRDDRDRGKGYKGWSGHVSNHVFVQEFHICKHFKHKNQ